MDSAAAPPSARHPLAQALPLLGSLGYLAFGALWIWLSDLFGAAVFPSTAQLTEFQTFKGVGFVALSAVVVHMVLRTACEVLHRLPQVEQRASDSEAQHRTTVDLSPDGIVLHEGGRILEANPAFRRTFALGPAQPLKGVLLADLVDPRDRDFIQERLQCLATETGNSSPTELALRSRGGAEIVVEHASYSVRRGERTVVQSHFRDLSFRNEARRELRRLNLDLDRRIRERTGELQAAIKALETFSYSVAHDLTAPVARVQGFAAALQDATANGDMQKAGRYAERIVANAAAMREMIDGLHRLSRAERAALVREPVDCNRMVRQVIAELDVPPDVSMRIDDLGTVDADAATLRQVWANLISNAVKYSSQVQCPEVSIGCRHGAGGVSFHVTDNGVGFDPADADRLFGVFQRLPTAQGFDGTGIGLTIVKRIVERHGGAIAASSRPGEGATFVFSLPQATQAVPECTDGAGR